MRYPAAETAEKHKRILEEASRLFRERGFSSVSVSEIMQATGLTHGPFYNHFTSKEALISECIAYASELAIEGIEECQQSPEAMRDFVVSYLSNDHRDAPGAGCVMAALGSDIAREPNVQTIFTAHVKAMVRGFTTRFPWAQKNNARRDAIRMLSSMVGAMILARAVDDEALSDEILNQVRSEFQSDADVSRVR